MIYISIIIAIVTTISIMKVSLDETEDFFIIYYSSWNKRKRILITK